jgi:hypothetical protein
MNLSGSTISIQVDPIFSSTSNEDYTHLHAPLPFPTKKETRTKKFEKSPSLGSLKIGWLFFFGSKRLGRQGTNFGEFEEHWGHPQDDIDLSR